MLTLGHVIEALTGYQSGGGTQIITDVVIDPRLAIPGALFGALPSVPGAEAAERGGVTTAFARGANAALMQRDQLARDPALHCQILDLREPVTHAQVAALEPPVCLRVEDALKAMQTLAAYWRGRLGPRVIGVTGSVGKTTTTELIAAVLSTRYRTFKSQGNYQHEVSVPLMLLKLTEAHEPAVLEMGFDHPGEIKFLAELARPHVGVVNNVYAVHLDRAGSLQAIPRGKARLVEPLPPAPEGVAVLNADRPLVLGMRPHTRPRG